ncbi:BgTH12-05768 [Blumeria graminis f. sp. triticale]|uniref:Protein phosphatase n=3 Tax=Blumeria graminis TaxID=34373 RepID=A0A9X9QEB0_BLUGR|nr:hypothetical protein BGT96224_A20781 [Blumeria graminis f. sp. tritici 96224]CAD6504031.1 BgTH12-05768 [Blumeria graminis f. sp. triticale]VDB90763.1 BgtA-20781 [Blumeria graminis f. sp. tritici]
MTTRSLIPFRFVTGIALFAKKVPRPFPPPFLSPPSASFSDPLSTFDRGGSRHAFLNGDFIRGHTNGEDAVYTSDYFIAASDGVGAWSAKPHGHAGLWSRLILHFWAQETEKDLEQECLPQHQLKIDPIRCLQRAYEQTIQATSGPNKCHGSTTTTGAQLYHRLSDRCLGQRTTPLLYITNLGDSQVLVLRPRDSSLVYKTKQQWHWFDCPRQLGTNSPDTPAQSATMDIVDIEENDVILVMSDGVIDNLWDHEIIENVVASLNRWKSHKGNFDAGNGAAKFAAEELMKSAWRVAIDPFAESPYMENAVEEGLAMEGGKLDDISIVVALCRRINT